MKTADITPDMPIEIHQIDGQFSYITAENELVADVDTAALFDSAGDHSLINIWTTDCTLRAFFSGKANLIDDTPARVDDTPATEPDEEDTDA